MVDDYGMQLKQFLAENMFKAKNSNNTKRCTLDHWLHVIFIHICVCVCADSAIIQTDWHVKRNRKIVCLSVYILNCFIYSISNEQTNTRDKRTRSTARGELLLFTVVSVSLNPNVKRICTYVRASYGKNQQANVALILIK